MPHKRKAGRVNRVNVDVMIDWNNSISIVIAVHLMIVSNLHLISHSVQEIFGNDLPAL